MKKISKKIETLLLGLCTANASFYTPLKDLYKAFMLGELRVFDSNTGVQLNPIDYVDCNFELVIFGSQEKMGEYFNSLPHKPQGQESGTCTICRLFRRVNQLRSELSEINKQLNETYGIVSLAEFLSLQSKCPVFRTPHLDGNKKCYSCSRKGMTTHAQGTVSLTHREMLDSFCLRDAMDLL